MANQANNFDLKTQVALVLQCIAQIQESIKKMEERLTAFEGKIDQLERDFKSEYVTRAEFKVVESNYVRQDQFKPYRDIIYGMVALILIGVLGWILKSAFGDGFIK